MERARRRGLPLFLLVHWTALDAVFVLVAYQWALGRWVDAAIPAPAWAFLASGIWLGYTSDRLFDLRKSPELAASSPRHAFLARHGREVKGVWVAVAAATCVLAPLFLGLRHLAVGVVLVGLAAIYVAVASGIPGPEVKMGAEAKQVATVGLLTLAGAWWFLGDPRALTTAGVWVMLVFAGAAWWNLRALRGATHGQRESREIVALVADGTVLTVMLVLGALAP